eukprot:6181595-Pleurochrysis_carterae.AAC.1
MQKATAVQELDTRGLCANCMQLQLPCSPLPLEDAGGIIWIRQSVRLLEMCWLLLGVWSLFP